MVLGPSNHFDYPDRRGFQTMYGVVMMIVPGDHTQPIDLERAPDSGGSPGTYAHVRTVSVPKAGGYVFDPLPNDNATRWYRCRHSAGGNYGNAGAYATAFTATPRKLIPDTLAEQGTASGPFTRTDDIDPGAVDTDRLASSAVTPPKAQARNRCRVYNSGVQGINNDVQTTLAWDSEDYDSNSLHSTSSNPSRITVPASGNTGVWSLFCHVSWVAGAGDRAVYISKNGADVATSIVPAAAGLFGGVGVRTSMTLAWQDDAPAVGDYYEVKVRQNSGGALNVATDSHFGALHSW